MSQPEVVVCMDDILAAYNAEDWTRFRAALADDLTVGDHRPPPAVYDGVAGPDEFVAAVRALFDLASGVSVQKRATQIVDQRAAVFQLCTTGVSDQQSAFELAFQLASVVDAGKITRLEFFADNQLDAACALLRAR